MNRDRPVNAAETRSHEGELEERRLALEFERLKVERQRAGIELRLKRRELKTASTKGWANLLPLPLIVGGVITLITSIVTSYFSTVQSINAEVAKARGTLQADLIKKFVESPNPQTVRANLRFLVDVGLVPDYAGNIQSFLNKNPDSSLPSSFTAVPSSLQYVHSDDDAIDLVIRFEGGWSDDPRDPGGATNYGITLNELSRYLGKTASKDDLRNLSVATARDFYRKLYLLGAASGLTSIQVRAVYLSLASNSGSGRAARIFQAAANKLGMPAVPDDGVLSPSTVQFINAADSDLFIETANCEAVKFYKTLHTFSMFGSGWIKRLQSFSPANVKGVCPELLPPPDSPGSTRVGP
jgi:lysozyme family protein